MVDVEELVDEVDREVDVDWDVLLVEVDIDTLVDELVELVD